MIKKLFCKKSLNLIREYIIAEFKQKYKGMLLGFCWIILHPILLFIILYTVFSHYMKFQIEHYPFYLLFGIIFWTFFEKSTARCVPIIEYQGDLIKKAYFPHEIMIISVMLINFIAFVIESILLFTVMYIKGIHVSFMAMLFLAGVVALEIFMILGMSFLLSALYVVFRDINNIWGVLLRLGFFVMPIIYPVSAIPKKFAWIYSFNPFAQLLNAGRDALLCGQRPNGIIFAGSLAFSVVILWMGIAVFRRSKPRFAERV